MRGKGLRTIRIASELRWKGLCRKGLKEGLTRARTLRGEKNPSRVGEENNNEKGKEERYR